MSEETNTNEFDPEIVLTDLKERADKLGISYHPSIGIDKLREKIQTKLAEDEKPDEGPETTTASTPPAVVEVKVKTPEQIQNEKRDALKKKALRLRKVRITCMNPAKSKWEGELFTTGNDLLGTISKMVPFNVEWHVPQIIYNMIKARKYMVWSDSKDAKGNTIQTSRAVPEFAVEDLPDLTEAELADLRRQQAMAKSSADR